MKSNRRVDEPNSAFSSAWEGERVLDGFASIGRMETELSKAQDDPKDLNRQFEKARYWFKEHWFVRAIILIRYAFFTYGFSIKSETGKVSPGLRRWEEQSRKLYRRYAREAWLEWLVLENVIGLWRQAGGKPPLVFPPEKSKFKDHFGEEVLLVRHGVTVDQVSTLGAFSKVEVKEMTRTPNEMKLTHDNAVFGFDVCRRERTGAGLGIPSLKPLFVPLAQLQSLDVGDQQLAAACRTVLEQHQLGHEIKSGIRAGAKDHFIKKERVDGFKKEIKGKTGHVQACTNFDHQIKQAANWPDPKVWDPKRYDSGINKVALWSMPLGQMLLGKSINPFLMPMLKYQALAEREYMEEHLRTVFVEALGAPEDIKPSWSNRCFSDPRVAADLLKTGMAAGPISQGTYLEESGYDQAQEWERKEVEAKQPKRLTTPIFDAAHGAPKKPAGRKPGTRDGEGDGE